jgi:hypothetical protein
LLCFFATLLRKPKAVKQKHGIASLLASPCFAGEAFIAFGVLLRSPSFCFISGYARPPACEAKNKARRFCYLFSI